MGAFLAVLAALLLLLGLDFLGSRGEKPALVRGETLLYRIPDRSGTPEARLREGRRVLVRALAGSWVYLEDPEGLAGWAPREAVILY
jgi:hypothetical protein